MQSAKQAPGAAQDHPRVTASGQGKAGALPRDKNEYPSATGALSVPPDDISHSLLDTLHLRDTSACVFPDEQYNRVDRKVDAANE